MRKRSLYELNLKSLKSFIRVEYILALHKSPTEKLINMHDLGLFSAKQTEDERKRGPPYISLQNFAVILNFRSKVCSDEIAGNFLREKFGFFKTLQF
jgi:hypothetical protein